MTNILLVVAAVVAIGLVASVRVAGRYRQLRNDAIDDWVQAVACQNKAVVERDRAIKILEETKAMLDAMKAAR